MPVKLMHMAVIVLRKPSIKISEMCSPVLLEFSFSVHRIVDLTFPSLVG